MNTMENNMAIPKKLNTELSYDTVIPPSRYIPKRTWMDQTSEVYTYKFLKRNKILKHATTWTNLKNITLSDVTQTQKNKYCMIPLKWDT